MELKDLKFISKGQYTLKDSCVINKNVYTPIKTIATGAYGSVKLGKREDDGKKYALKVILNKFKDMSDH